MDQGTIIWLMLVSYKIVVLLIGLAFAYMGYRLFLADKIAGSGDLTGSAGEYAITLKGGAPGVFFSLFGAAIIAVSLFKGISYADSSTPTSSNNISVVLPELEAPYEKKPSAGAAR